MSFASIYGSVGIPSTRKFECDTEDNVYILSSVSVPDVAASRRAIFLVMGESVEC
jgi:hypothetical protein